MSARDLLATEARLAVALRQAPTNQEAAAALSTVSQYAALVNQTQDEQSLSVLNDPTVAACRSALLWSQSATVLSDGASTLSQCCVGAASARLLRLSATCGDSLLTPWPVLCRGIAYIALGTKLKPEPELAGF